jgi:hypothetical protein
MFSNKALTDEYFGERKGKLRKIHNTDMIETRRNVAVFCRIELVHYFEERECRVRDALLTAIISCAAIYLLFF